MPRKTTTTPSIRFSETEARAEAQYIVLRLMIGNMPTRQRNRLAAHALIACDDIGSPEIMEELEALFDHADERPTR
jgi:hypothetical protein